MLSIPGRYTNHYSKKHIKLNIDCVWEKGGKIGKKKTPSKIRNSLAIVEGTHQ